MRVIPIAKNFHAGILLTIGHQSEESRVKRGNILMTIILSILNRFKKITGRFLGKFAVKWILKIPPHVACVATLPCETLMSATQAINDKLQGSVATYLRCGGVVNNHIDRFIAQSE